MSAFLRKKIRFHKNLNKRQIYWYFSEEALRFPKIIFFSFMLWELLYYTRKISDLPAVQSLSVIPCSVRIMNANNILAVFKVRIICNIRVGNWTSRNQFTVKNRIINILFSLRSIRHHLFTLNDAYKKRSLDILWSRNCKSTDQKNKNYQIYTKFLKTTSIRI